MSALQQNRYWDAAKTLVGKTLYTQKKAVPFTIIEVDRNIRYKRQSGRISTWTYSREKVESCCRHRESGGEIAIDSLYRAGIEKNPNRGEYSYLPAIVDEILKLI